MTDSPVLLETTNRYSPVKIYRRGAPFEHLPGRTRNVRELTFAHPLLPLHPRAFGRYRDPDRGPRLTDWLAGVGCV
jgi:hypothetical protein